MWPFGLFTAAHYAAADGSCLCKSEVRHCAPCRWKCLWYTIKCRRPPLPCLPDSFQHAGYWVIDRKWNQMRLIWALALFWRCASRCEVIQLEDQRKNRKLRYVWDVWGARDRKRTGGERLLIKPAVLPVDTGLSPGSGMTQNREAIFISLCGSMCVCVCKVNERTWACMHICTLERVTRMGF